MDYFCRMAGPSILSGLGHHSVHRTIELPEASPARPKENPASLHVNRTIRVKPHGYPLSNVRGAASRADSVPVGYTRVLLLDAIWHRCFMLLVSLPAAWGHCLIPKSHCVPALERTCNSFIVLSRRRTLLRSRRQIHKTCFAKLTLGSSSMPAIAPVIRSADPVVTGCAGAFRFPCSMGILPTSRGGNGKET